MESVTLSGSPAVISPKGRFPLNYSIAGNQHHSNTYFLDPLITEAKKKKKKKEEKERKQVILLSLRTRLHQTVSIAVSLSLPECQMPPSRELKIKVPSKKHTDASITSNPDQKAQP